MEASFARIRRFMQNALASEKLRSRQFNEAAEILQRSPSPSFDQTVSNLLLFHAAAAQRMSVTRTLYEKVDNAVLRSLSSFGPRLLQHTASSKPLPHTMKIGSPSASMRPSCWRLRRIRPLHRRAKTSPVIARSTHRNRSRTQAEQNRASQRHTGLCSGRTAWSNLSVALGYLCATWTNSRPFEY